MTRDELTTYLSSLDDVTHERVADLIAWEGRLVALDWSNELVREVG